jgi:hypothetical protein
LALKEGGSTGAVFKTAFRPDYIGKEDRASIKGDIKILFGFFTVLFEKAG